MFIESVQREKADMDISLTRANLWFVVIWLIWVLDIMDKMAINAVLPLLKSQFHFTDAQLGTISSIVSLAIGLLALPVAMLVDRWSRRKVIAIMVGLWSLATFFTGRATGYLSLLLARSSVGVGEAGYQPAGITLIGVWYPQKMRGLMMGILYSAAPLGNVTGIILAGVLAYHYGWRACFGILAVPGLILAFLAWFLPDYKTIKKDKTGDTRVKVGLGTNLLNVLRSPALLFTYLLGAAITMAILAFSSWAVTFFVRTFGMNVKQGSILTGVTILCATPGTIFGGWLGDKLSKKMNWGRLIACAVNAMLFLILITIALQITTRTKNLPLVVTFWTLSVFFLLGIVSNQFTVVQDLAGPHFRATAAGFIPLVQQVLGGFPGPIIVGVLSDRLGLVAGLQAIAVLSVALTVVFSFLAMRFYDGDLKRVKQMGIFELQGETVY